MGRGAGSEPMPLDAKQEGPREGEIWDGIEVEDLREHWRTSHWHLLSLIWGLFWYKKEKYGP